MQVDRSTYEGLNRDSAARADGTQRTRDFSNYQRSGGSGTARQLPLERGEPAERRVPWRWRARRRRRPAALGRSEIARHVTSGNGLTPVNSSE